MALHIFSELLTAYRLTHILVGVHVLVDVIVGAEYAAGAGIIACTVNRLLKRQYAEFSVLLLYGHQSGVVTARYGHERVTILIVPPYPEIAPDPCHISAYLLGRYDHQGGDAELSLPVLHANLLYEIIAYGITQSLLPAVVLNISDAVLLVLVKVRYQPLAAHFLHV